MADDIDAGDDLKLTVGRGPSYPFIDLQRALDRVFEITAKGAERTKLSPETFYKLWNYAPKSSGARQTMAALNSYGLVEYVGKGTDRRVQLTDLARRIALDKRPGSPDRERAMAQAVIEPPVFAELYDTYGPILPDKTVMEYWLVSEKGFNQQGAEAAVANFISSFMYAGMDKPTQKPDENGSQRKPDMVDTPKPSVGDFVEVEVGGQLQFAKPVRVRATTPDGAWFFVEGTETGYSMEQVKIVDHPDGQDRKPPTLPLEQAKVATSTNDLKPVFDFDSVTINTKITSQWHLTELISRLAKLMPLLPEGDDGKQKDD
ncbi:hypothetical protein [Sphingobium algorifonticola]|uniref:Uncharacterized protein n=1 Tax=Sphingobium algorifonticola TaxID=2008318 RepID=A0A437J871_9SPHN|nr:hypothetical protein [Sphingobium algorifonticola]RVT41711.1 hypothetical protein ENE74_05325 [Sphingobium algorifonticola]RVT42009.1 hypothetical protein ENE74_07120 [Sphingobium algorifonticola]